jgi:Tol biopolymer transport system component
MTNFHLYGNDAGPVALSPDGKHFAFVAADSTGKRYLYLRGMDDLVPRRLAETDGASQPFWSPDNRFIAFAARGKLKKIDVAGGAPIIICDAPFSRGGTWSDDGIIIFAPGPANPLAMVPAKGGIPVRVTKLDSLRRENSHRWPSFLPDGKHFLYLARTVATGSRNEGDAICVGSIDGKENTVLTRTSSNAQFASGYLLFTRGGSLVAQRLDEHSFELTGEPVTIAAGVAFDQSIDRSMFTVSQNGILLFQTGSVQLGSRIIFADRTGKRVRAIDGELAEYYLPRLSPDEKKLSCYIYDFQSHNADIWIHDLARGFKTRFTFTPTYETFAVWSPNGSRIVYSANSNGKYDLFVKSADGAGMEELLLRSREDKSVVDWSSDGKFLLYITAGDSATQTDLWVLPLTGEKKPVPFLKTEFNERDARFSPDAKWIAYVSDESGKDEIYIRSFPDRGSKRQVSIAGGDSPRWRRNGKELYYFSTDNKMMAADISYKDGTVEVNHVRSLFDIPLIVSQPYADYDVTADGKRFLLNIPFESQNSTPLTLVVNWEAEVKKK